MVRLIGGLGAELGENDEVDGVSRALGPDQLVRATSPGRGRGMLGMNCGGAGAEV